MKIVFAGTPDFAAIHLKALLDSRHEVIAVYTQPDRPKGRGKKLSPSPVKAVALDAEVPVYQPLSFKNAEDRQQLDALKADIMVVVAYGLLLPKSVLEMPRLGCINVHGSILPRWRGAAPIQRAIEAGDTESGVTIMQMDVGLDTGDMLLKKTCEILPTDTATDLHDRLAAIGPDALLESLDQLEKGTASPEQQNDAESNYASKLLKEEGKINWELPSSVICARIRAFNPFPICYASVGGERLRIWFANEDTSHNGSPGKILSAGKDGIVVATSDGAINITQLQLPNKKPMSAADIMNGFAHLFEPGKVLS